MLVCKMHHEDGEGNVIGTTILLGLVPRDLRNLAEGAVLPIGLDGDVVVTLIGAPNERELHEVLRQVVGDGNGDGDDLPSFDDLPKRQIEVPMPPVQQPQRRRSAPPPSPRRRRH